MATNFNGQNSPVPTSSMKPHQLDLNRAKMMDVLYARSGRADLPKGHPLRSTYTGLWEEFCRDIAANFRDTDYAELHADVVTAMDATQSVMAQKQAQQAIAVCRRHLLRQWA